MSAMTTMPTMFDPITIATLRLQSRFVRSATAERIAMEQPGDGERLGAIYAALARGGVGLIITGHVAVHPSGRAYPLMAALFNERHAVEWGNATALAHAAGGVLVAQLNHGGGRCQPSETCAPVCVSVLPERPRDPLRGVELSAAAIEELIGAFAAAAARAKSAGMDGVQIHAAHGYLGTQFLSPATNRRQDEWGGALENRARFLRRVICEIRRTVGPGYPLGMKLGAADDAPDGLTLEDSLRAAQWFQADGLDFIEISGAFRSDICARKIKPEVNEGYYLPFAARFKAALSIPVLAVGGFRSLKAMHGALASGACDAVAMARPLVRQPDLPAGLGQGGASACVSCNLCLLKNDLPLRCYRKAGRTPA